MIVIWAGAVFAIVGLFVALVDAFDRGFKLWRFIFIVFFWVIIDLWYLVKK